MLALVQDFRKGELTLVDAPVPALTPGCIQVRNLFSFVSPGTEIATIRFARKSLVGKALARKDLLAKVIGKAKREGVFAAFKSAMVRLEEPLPLGYSCAGIVEAVADGVTEFKPGDTVACAGVGYGSHAEIVCVPRNLSTKVPEGVAPRDASTVALGAIAVEALRIADLRLGESAVVLGLGAVGQILVQVLRSAGCRVFGYDPDELCVSKTAQVAGCSSFSDTGALAESVLAQTRSAGADCVIIAAATESNEPVELAPGLLRKRGSVVVLGTTGLEIPRRPYYEKELRLLFTTSYGPGRYDPQYEVYGHDYPLAYARWTEKRNMEAYLRLLADGLVKTDAIMDADYPIEEGLKAYERLDKGELRGVVFSYKADKKTARIVEVPRPVQTVRSGLRFGIIGAGSFARSTLIPGLLELGARPVILCTRTPTKALVYAKKYGFESSTSDEKEVVQSDVDFVVIATPHSEHPRMIASALREGKPVFCEKPLAIDGEGLNLVLSAYESTRVPFMIGFNRRFSPAVSDLKKNIPAGTPAYASYIVNAGRLDGDSWLVQPQEGGRVAGEVCHFVDACLCLVGADVLSVYATSPVQEEVYNECAATLHFADDSIAQILYSTCGAKTHMKERIELHRGQRTAVVEDFRRLKVFGGKKTELRYAAGMKGHKEELSHFLETLRGRASLEGNIRAAFASTAATLAILTSLRTGAAVRPERVEIRKSSK